VRILTVIGQYTTAWKGHACCHRRSVYPRDVSIMNDPCVGQSAALMGRPAHPSKQTRTLKQLPMTDAQAVRRNNPRWTPPCLKLSRAQSLHIQVHSAKNQSRILRRLDEGLQRTCESLPVCWLRLVYRKERKIGLSRATTRE
jgi:hypothetical protein